MSELDRPSGAVVEERGEVSVGMNLDDLHLPRVPQRHYGRWVGGLACVGLMVVLVFSFAQADVNYSVTVDYIADPTILSGVVTTLEITLISMLVGVVLGVSAAIMRQSVNPVLRVVANGYIWFFRGTPVLVQLLIWFNLGLIFPTFHIPGFESVPMNQLMTPLLAAVLGLGINEGSYMSEIVRSGLIAVSQGQSEAAQALGMTRGQTLRRVVMPQAMRVITPPVGNEFIMMLKTSSLAYVISVSELLNSSYRIYSVNLDVVELLFTASIWYLVLTTIFTMVQYRLERRLGRGHAAVAVRRKLGARLIHNLSGRRR